MSTGSTLYKHLNYIEQLQKIIDTESKFSVGLQSVEEI